MYSATNDDFKLARNLFLTITVVFILYVLKSVMIPLLFGIIISVMLYPITKFLERKFRFRRLASSITVLLFFILIVLGIFFFVGYQISEILSKSDIYGKRLSELSQEIVGYISSNFNINADQALNLKKVNIEELVKSNFSKISDFISASGALVGDSVLALLYIFFFLYYRKFFIEFIHKLFPKKNNEYLTSILVKIYDAQQDYMVGMVTVMIIVGVLNTVGLLILGIENAFFFGFLGGFLILFPYIGVIVGSLLPALVALATKDSAWYSVGVLAVFGFVQFLEGNFITPKITGSKISINSFVIIVSLLLFSLLWGLSGMILAIPATAALKIILDHVPNYKAYAFLLSEPKEEHLERTVFNRLKIWKKIRENNKKFNE